MRKRTNSPSLLAGEPRMLKRDLLRHRKLLQAARRFAPHTFGVLPALMRAMTPISTKTQRTPKILVNFPAVAKYSRGRRTTMASRRRHATYCDGVG